MEHRRIPSLNDRRSILNDKGKISTHCLKTSLISSESKNDSMELHAYKLPPKYMEKYDISNDIIKELYIKCKHIIYIVNKLQEDQQKE